VGQEMKNRTIVPIILSAYVIALLLSYAEFIYLPIYVYLPWLAERQLKDILSMNTNNGTIDCVCSNLLSKLEYDDGVGAYWSTSEMGQTWHVTNSKTKLRFRFTYEKNKFVALDTVTTSLFWEFQPCSYYFFAEGCYLDSSLLAELIETRRNMGAIHVTPNK